MRSFTNALGNMQTVDVIFPSFPFFAYAEPRLLLAVLEPLLLHQEAGLYPNRYSMHDLGSSYPNATGHADGADEYMPVEECGNMVIMLKAAYDLCSLVDRNGTYYMTQWLSSHYAIADQWTEYLLEFGLIPATQLSTDDFAGALANQSNLALKAIIGIKAMAQIAQITGHQSRANVLSNIAYTYSNTWRKLTFDFGVPFAKLAYQWHGSWGSLYNLFADKFLQTGLIDREVYSMQSDWYSKIVGPYGLPLDSRHTYTKSDWQMFIASIVSRSTAKILYERLNIWLNETTLQRPFPDLYDTNDGASPGFIFTNRPVVGGMHVRWRRLLSTKYIGHFAALALARINKLRDSTRQSGTLLIQSYH